MRGVEFHVATSSLPPSRPAINPAVCVNTKPVPNQYPQPDHLGEHMGEAEPNRH